MDWKQDIWHNTYFKPVSTLKYLLKGSACILLSGKLFKWICEPSSFPVNPQWMCMCFPREMVRSDKGKKLLFKFLFLNLVGGELGSSAA